MPKPYALYMDVIHKSKETRRENYFNEYRRRGKITREQCKEAIAAVKETCKAG